MAVTARILSLLGLLALVGCSIGGDSGEAGEAVPIDRAFIDMMVPHHESAVAMAEAALERAEHEELRSMAHDIIAAQTAEIEQMRAWREDWFGSADTPPMDAMPLLPGMEAGEHAAHGDTMDMAAEVAALREADPFDQAFIDAMIAHHEQAIEAAEIALEQTERDEIRQLATAIIGSQQAEIDQLRAWREEWY